MEAKKYTVASVLSIAGFDGSGGAGIQADTKTISALGCYAMNVLTALPVQNTQGVKNIYEIPTQAIKDQLETLFEDIYPTAIKIGMVHSTILVELIADFLKDYRGPIIFDPVMVSTSGHRLIQADTIQACIDKLFPIATLITPNLDEVAVLINEQVDSLAKMRIAGAKLLQMGCQAVLVKGGHLPGDDLSSIFLSAGKDIQFDTAKIETDNTHGSGCTLSSAIASYLARGEELPTAVGNALDYVNKAIQGSQHLALGRGNGPLNHFHNPQKLIVYDMD
ncbi:MULTISPECIES: bifunctional hydroxymethylpyrimidine kinase/phosphomethylpyrimidine kinase [Sphingobacterium]|uniref:bifunctional hydroxymethylpyrimidine kinase/phosphomethylpyrimidine kinase n=1 Tax=Sphingobacterium TaxID=28453 RepID=UPI0013DCC6F2|nr:MULTISPECIES: bifunctional hydroxymethylpyrimidine kinase/phosphomethylpyrimidine kinase [unclassified Sphingobacterium]